MFLYDLKDNYCNKDARLEVKLLPQSLKLKHRERSVEQREPGNLEDFIRVAREVIQRELQERCFDRKISNSRLVQVYMSQQPGMDAQKVLQRQYITVETLYMTYLREANDVLKLTTPRQSPRKTQKFSGGFRGVSVLESEASEPPEFDAVSDEIRRWSSLSEGECQCFVSAEDGILNEFEMM